jgi:hypothetical protein
LPGSLKVITPEVNLMAEIPSWTIVDSVGPTGQVRPSQTGSPTAVPASPTRLIRFAASLGMLRDELRLLTDPLSVDWLQILVEARLREAEQVIPPELGDELRRLLSPVLLTGETSRDLEVVLAQLDGWIGGLISQIALVVPNERAE